MVTVAESLGREPIAGSPLNFSLSFIPLKAQVIPTMLTFGNVREQKSTNFSNLIIKYFLFQSISTCSCLLKEEFQTLSVTDIYRETLKRYHDRGSPSPIQKLYHTQHTSLPYHSQVFCKSRQIALAEFNKRSQRSIPKKDNLGFGAKYSPDRCRIPNSSGFGCVNVPRPSFCAPPLNTLLWLRARYCTVLFAVHGLYCGL